MSMHKIPLTKIEEDGLRAHGLYIGTPSQLSDAFRQGVAWAQKAAQTPLAMSEINRYDPETYGAGCRMYQCEDGDFVRHEDHTQTVQQLQHTNKHYQNLYQMLRLELAESNEKVQQLQRENERLKDALTKINDIRNSILGFQTLNWSEHVYPLVAALNSAGIAGLDYPAARDKCQTLLDELAAAKQQLTKVENKKSHLSFNFDSDGVWLCFDAGNGRKAMLNLDIICDQHGANLTKKIMRDAIDAALAQQEKGDD